jgi:hypothetical protein
MQFSVLVGQGFQFIEHDGHIPRHAHLIGLGMVRLGPRFLQFVLELGAFFNQLPLVDLDPLQFGSMVGALPGIPVASWT